jgi:hypothetical protein
MDLFLDLNDIVARPADASSQQWQEVEELNAGQALLLLADIPYVKRLGIRMAWLSCVRVMPST